MIILVILCTLIGLQQFCHIFYEDNNKIFSLCKSIVKPKFSFDSLENFFLSPQIVIDVKQDSAKYIGGTFLPVSFGNRENG